MKKLLTATALSLIATTALAHKIGDVPPGEVPDLYDVAIEPSPERIRDDIQTLVDFGTRHTLSETESDTRGIGAARRWIFAEFEKISKECGGCLEVIYISDSISGERRIPEPTEVVSVLAIQKGSIDPNRYVMMSGDIDSRVTDPLDGTSDSPGANDNASGMAGVIEAARVLSKRKYAGSIIYAGLSGEEQGLFGGEIVAKHALDEGWEIKGVLNNDMISNISGIDGVTDNSSVRVFSEGTRANETEEEARKRRFTGGEVDSPSRNLARYVKSQADQYMANLNVMMIYRLDRFARGGHHRPFNKVGIPGVRIMEVHEHYDRQHQDLRQSSELVWTRKPRFADVKVDESELDKLRQNNPDMAIVREEIDGALVWRPTVKTVTVLSHPERTKIVTSKGEFLAHEVYNMIERATSYGDVMDGVDPIYAAKLTGLNAITLAGMAGAPPFPANVEASGAVQASATLTWEKPRKSGNHAGYRVHWRLTTEPEWTHSRYVGDVTEWEFTNLVIDNYFFGVSAVSKDGFETPVVFPGAAGRF